MSASVPVFYESIRVGSIDVDEEGPAFQYDESWPRRRGAFPISLRVPLTLQRAGPEIMTPWLMNLLPEGNALSVMSRLTGTAPEDVVSVLMQVGRDTAGALSIGEPRPATAEDTHIEVSDGDLEKVIEELPRRPFLVGESGVSMSLAGAQEKLPVYKTDGRLRIPIDGTPSTHILKPDNKSLYGSVQNEALCMTLARRLGLPVAEVTTGTAGQRSYLLVTRYDRSRRDGRWRRLHQEDFCQALGKPPGAKYQHNRTGIPGPSLRDFFELVRRATTAQAVLQLTDAIVFNVLVTNVDSHAKNYSLMLSGRGAAMAPLYDLMCGAAWEDVTRNMAQDIGGKNRGEHIHRRHWERMAQDCGLNARALLRRIRDLANKVTTDLPAALDAVRTMPAGDHPMLPEFATAIEHRCATITANLAEAAVAAPAAAPGKRRSAPR